MIGDGQGNISLDSLLDTMTNVVGILVILLVVTQFGVRDAIWRIQWKMPDVSPRKLADLEERAQKKRTAVAALQTEWDERASQVEPSIAELERARETVALLHEKLRAQQREQIQRARSDGHQAELQAEVRRLREEIAQLQDRLARLKALHDETQFTDASRHDIIHLPDPRPAPAGATGIWMLCRFGKLAHADRQNLRQFAKLLIQAEGATLLHNPEKPALGYGPLKVQNFFANHDLGTRDFRLHVSIDEQLGTERLHIEFRPDGGETVNQFRSPSSLYQGTLRSIDPATAYVRFLVWPDSFEAYIAARKLLEPYGISAGWTLYTADRRLIGANIGIKLFGEIKAPSDPSHSSSTEPPLRPDVLD